MSVMEARSPEWHATRRTGIGSSDAPIITGDAPWGDLLTLYAVKAGIIDEPDNENRQTEWGRRLEDVVATWYAESTGRKVRRVNRILRHREHPWMLASLDRVAGRRVVEIKTRRYPDDEWGPAGTAEVPPHYLVQVQHQLAVTGYDEADLAVLFAGSDPRLYVIPRDDALIESLIELESEFMECVRTGSPPEPLVRRQRAIVPIREGEILAPDDGPLGKGIEGLYHLRQEIKALQKDEADATEAVKTLMGPMTGARSGPYRVAYKPNADSHPVRWELVAAAYRKALEEAGTSVDLDAIEALFTDTKPGFRPLRITRKEEAVNAA